MPKGAVNKIGWVAAVLLATMPVVSAGAAPGGQDRRNGGRRPGAIIYKWSDDATLFDQVATIAAMAANNAVPEHVGNPAGIEQMSVVLRGRSEEDVCDELLAAGGLEFAEPDFELDPSETIPNDPSYGSQWHHAVIQTPQAWDLTTGSTSVVVAIVDTGVQSDHPDLAANMQLPGKNTVDDSTNTEPTHYHGTHVAGCAAAIGNNGTGVAGAAWNVKILPIKISNASNGSAYLSDMYEGIVWATDNGADIVNISYSGASTSTMNSAGQYARDNGVLMFMAAGNDNTDISSWSDWTTFVLVGSTTTGDARSSFSNYGTPVDLVAPGSSILSTYPGGLYATLSGTSMASPVAAGVAALVLSADPTLTPAQLETLLYNTCDDIGASGEDSVFGHGRINAYSAVNTANGGAVVRAALTSPTNGSTFSSTSQTFTWSTGFNVTKYWLMIGSTSGGGDYLNADMNLSTSYGATGLPDDGSTVYVRLRSQIGGTWYDNDYSYTAYRAPTKAAMTSPTGGSTLSSTSQTFTWDAGYQVSYYSLFVGTTSGGQDLYNNASESATSFIVHYLLDDGSTIYVRLNSLLDGGWQYTDYTYTATTITPTKASMTSPADASTLTSTSVDFTWSGGQKVERYSLFVGSSAGAKDYLNRELGLATSVAVDGLPDDGSTVYVRLHTKLSSGGWQYNDYTYTAMSTTPVKAAMTSPADTSTLSSSSATFTWSSGTRVDRYALFVGSSLGAADFFSGDMATMTSYTVSDLPMDGSTLYVRLWSRISGAWQSNDYTYTAHSVTAVKAAMTSPANGATLSGSSATFSWTTGTRVDYYALFVGSSLGMNDYVSAATPTSTSYAVSNLPQDGNTLYVRLWSLIGGVWQNNDYTYTADFVASDKAAVISPANGATFSGSAETFSWTAGTRVDRYALFVGSWLGANDYLSADAGTGTSYPVYGLPQDGSTVYVRLWSRIGGAWQSNDYTYTADLVTAVKSVVSSPTDGATLSGSVETFTWTAGTRVDYHSIFVGSAPGFDNYYHGNMGDSTSVAVGGLPTGGGTVYVRLWSLISGVWQYNDYSYTAAP